MAEASRQSTVDWWKLRWIGAVAVLVVLLLGGGVVSGSTAEQTVDSSVSEQSSQDNSQAFEILELDPTTVELDEPRNVTVTVTLENSAERNIVEQVDLRMNGTTVTSRVLNLDRDEQREVQLRIPAGELEPGGYYVFSIWTETDATTGTVRVAPAPTPTTATTGTPTRTPTPVPETPTPKPTETPTPSSDGAGPGFGVATAVTTLLGLAVLLRGRRL